MGMFSYKCLLCGEPILHTLHDEPTIHRARLFYLEDGKVIEQMGGWYDGYGRTEDKPGECKGTEWKSREWTKMVNVHYDENHPHSGFAAAHVECIPKGWVPETRSLDDPNQGWVDEEKDCCEYCGDIYCEGEEYGETIDWNRLNDKEYLESVINKINKKNTYKLEDLF